jgi:mRNA interferase HigB
MNVISRPAVNAAIRAHPDAKDWLDAWWKIAAREQWTSLADVRAVYPRTDQVGSCLVFNVLGNHYRFIVGVRYATANRGGTLFVKHFLTHAEYDKDTWKDDCCYDD